MDKKQYGVMLMLAILAGFLGGAVASRLFATQPVFAEKKSRPEKVIEAQEFIVRDKSGTTRARLYVEESSKNSFPDSVGLTLYNNHGKSGVELFLTGDSPALGFFNPVNGVSHAAIIVAEGVPALILRDESGKDRTVLGFTQLVDTKTGTVEKRSASSMVLFDKGGEVICSVP
jgi:hypothetical protein